MQEHGALNEKHLALVAYEVLKMVKACHEAGLLHGDVKPANFCLKHKTRHPLTGGIGAPSSTWLKGIDFGCSQLLPGEFAHKSSNKRCLCLVVVLAAVLFTLPLLHATQC